MLPVGVVVGRAEHGLWLTSSFSLIVLGDFNSCPLRRVLGLYPAKNFISGYRGAGMPCQHLHALGIYGSLLAGGLCHLSASRSGSYG
jgi:hypothetical protein